MERKLLYIINPISGTNSKNDLQCFIETKTAQQNIPFKIFASVADGDYRFLQSIITKEKFTDIIIAGGDGTISQVIGSLKNLPVNFGIVPCGSGNGLALAAGISKNPAKALQTIFNGHTYATDGFYINSHFACMLCGLGFDAQVAHDFAQQPKRGLSIYIQQILKNFLTAKTYSFELKLKDANLQTDAFFISVANSNQFGNNMTIAPKASLADGLLDVVIVTSQHKMSVFIQMIKQIAGWNKLETQMIKAKTKGVIYFQTSELTIINKDLAPLHLDGDPLETLQELDIKINKNCFRLIQPLKEQV